MKLGQIINSKQALERLLQGVLPIDIAWEIKLFVNKLNPELISFEQIRAGKIKEYGEEVTEGEEKGMLKVKKENIDLFVKEINELLDKEITFNIPEIKINRLKEFKNKDGEIISISVEDLELLNWLIKE